MYSRHQLPTLECDQHYVLLLNFAVQIEHITEVTHSHL